MATDGCDQHRVLYKKSNQTEEVDMFAYRALFFAGLFIVSGCGREGNYVGVPSYCDESYEKGIVQVCNEIYRYSSDIHDNLRREKIC